MKKETEAREDAAALLSGRGKLMIVNAHALLRTKYRRRQLWVLVSDVTGYGSTMSSEICRGFGWDPNGLCGDSIRPLPEEAK